MGWLGGRDRRRGARRPGSQTPESEPTYLVERDAPAGGPVEWARRWVRQARERTTQDRYDAYPDHAQPFDGWGVPPPVLEPVAPPGDAVDAVKTRLPVPAGRKIRLMVVSEHTARVVPLPAPWTWLGLIDQRLLGAHVLSEIRRVVLEVIEAEDARQRTEDE